MVLPEKRPGLSRPALCWWAAAPLAAAIISQGDWREAEPCLLSLRKRWRAENIRSPWTTWVWIETLPWVPRSFIPLTNTRSGDKYQIKVGSFSSSPLKDSCASDPRLLCRCCWNYPPNLNGRLLQKCSGKNPSAALYNHRLPALLWLIGQIWESLNFDYSNIRRFAVTLSCFEFRFQVNLHILLGSFRCTSAPIIDINYC